jgi:hypothetical protein
MRAVTISASVTVPLDDMTGWHVARAWYATLPGEPPSALWTKPFQAGEHVDRAAREAVHRANGWEPLEVHRVDIFRLEAA